jgi:hypothetical protein
VQAGYAEHGAPFLALPCLALHSQRFHTLAVSGVPVFTAANRNEAYRFVTLIDVMYEHRYNNSPYHSSCAQDHALLNRDQDWRLHIGLLQMPILIPTHVPACLCSSFQANDGGDESITRYLPITSATLTCVMQGMHAVLSRGLSF